MIAIGPVLDLFVSDGVDQMSSLLLHLVVEEVQIYYFKYSIKR